MNEPYPAGDRGEGAAGRGTGVSKGMKAGQSPAHGGTTEML